MIPENNNKFMEKTSKTTALDTAKMAKFKL